MLSIAVLEKESAMAITSTAATRGIHTPRGWAPPVARAGYVTKGIIHILIGVLAIQTVVGAPGEGEIGGGDTAIRSIADQPFGQLLLGAVGLGLFAYAAWRFVQAILDPEGTAHDGAKGIAKRIGFAISGVIYGSLGVAAMQLALGESSSTGGGQQTWIAKVLAWDFGPALVVLAGAAVILYALFEIYRAWTIDFTKKLKVTKMSAKERRWAVRVGRAGLFARGVVLVIIGSGVIQAGLSSNAAQAPDVGGALQEIAAQPSGGVLLVVVAAGLIAYGVFQFVQARYRNIPSRV